MKKISVCFMIIILSISLFTGCESKKENENSTELYQVSTLQALILGDYEGAITVEELLKHGDTGLGTFDGLDGEMIVLDGKVYKATVDGEINVVPDDETIPFANVAFINSDKGQKVSFEGGIEELKKEINDLFPDENMPVIFCISGDFENIQCRSVPEQEEPYPLLTDVVKNQAVFNKDSASGTIVGFRFPAYMSELNAVGFHLHFLSDDKTFGGHLLNVDSGDIDIKAQILNEFNMYLPDNLKEYNLEDTNEDDVNAVEKSSQ